MIVQRVSLEDFKKIAKDVHYYAFKEVREADDNTFDFALLALKDETPMAYTTCIELDSRSVYMQHGGSLPDAKGSIYVSAAYANLISHLKAKYDTISTRVLNTNIPMLRLAIAAGFLITGVDFHKNDGEIYLHLTLDAKGQDEKRL